MARTSGHRRALHRWSSARAASASASKKGRNALAAANAPWHRARAKNRGSSSVVEGGRLLLDDRLPGGDPLELCAVDVAFLPRRAGVDRDRQVFPRLVVFAKPDISRREPEVELVVIGGAIDFFGEHVARRLVVVLAHRREPALEVAE